MVLVSLQWRLYVWREEHWPAWMLSLFVLVAVGAVVTALLLFLVLLSR